MIGKKSNNQILNLALIASILLMGLLLRILILIKSNLDAFTADIFFFSAILLLGAIHLLIVSLLNRVISPIINKMISARFPENTEHQKPQFSTTSLIEKLQSEALKQSLEKEHLILNKALSYTQKELALYLDTEQMLSLCEYIKLFQFGTEADCLKISHPVKLSSKLRPIDVMHFGWNLGNAFNKSGIEIATFLKRVFAELLHDTEISTLKRKLRTEGNCIIDIKTKI